MIRYLPGILALEEDSWAVEVEKELQESETKEDPNSTQLNVDKKLKILKKQTTMIPNTFLFNGRALNFGILAIISCSSSSELFTFTKRTLCEVTNSGSLGLVNCSLGFPCIEKHSQPPCLKPRWSKDMATCLRGKKIFQKCIIGNNHGFAFHPCARVQFWPLTAHRVEEGPLPLAWRNSPALPAIRKKE